jgi:hypothetical protein
MPDRMTRVGDLDERQVARLRDQIRSFVAGATELEQEQQPADCDVGGGSGHSSHCDNDGWV